MKRAGKNLGRLVLKNLIITSLLLACSTLSADYIYEANQDLYDLQTNSSGSTGLGSNDDSVSPAFNLGFTFTFYGNDYTQARMATNGCLHFNLTGSYCGDYTPDPLPQYTNTLFPFWTDLIKDNGSAMKAKAFDDYTIFGWYKMREYNRSGSDNSIEVWLYPNNTYEYRYGELDIKTHDVLIGEQGSTSQIYTYHFFDECNTGTTNVSGTCVSYDWNSSSNAVNTLLEDGGSLYGDGTNQSLCATAPLTSVNCSGYAAAYFTQQCDISALYNADCTGYAAAYLAQQCGLSALYDSSCSGYAAAYLAQQCGLNDLYSSSCEGYAVAYLSQQCGLNDLYDTACPNYDTAYRIQQCDEDSQYSPTCNGYVQDTVATYYVEDTTDYGYEDDYWIDDDPYYGMEFTDEEWYEIDLEEFGQEQVDEWYGTDVAFNDEGWIDWDSSQLNTWEDLDTQMDIYDMTVEDLYYDIPEELEYINDSVDVLDAEELVELYEFDTILREDLNYEEEDNYLAFENEEELDEWYEEEMEESQETIEEQFVEAEEESYEEEIVEEEWIAEANEEEVVLEDLEEVELVGTVEREGSSMDMETALSVVASTMQTAMNSVSGTTAGTTISATGQNSISGNTSSAGNSSVSNVASVAASSSSSGGFSTSSSPSISDQIQTAQVQTNTVLSLSQDMGSTSGMGGSTQTVSNVSIVSSPMPTVDDSPQVAIAEVQVQDMQTQIDTAVADVSTPSEVGEVVSTIVSQKIETQQEQSIQEQEDTGQYSDESTLVALLGYVPGFSAYREAKLPPQPVWYESRIIYANNYMTDNISGFYNLAGTSLNKMGEMINQQPNL